MSSTTVHRNRFSLFSRNWKFSRENKLHQVSYLRTPIMTSQVFISDNFFEHSTIMKAKKGHFSTYNISAMQYPITLGLRDKFIWLSVNT